MQLNITTDYAIRIVLFLAKNNHVVSSKKLADVIKVSPRYLLQISSKLRDAGVIRVTHGSNGGIALAQPPKAINLYDIIIIMEGTVSAQSVSSQERNNTEEFIFLSTAYDYVDFLLAQSLQSITIDSLLSQSEDQWHAALLIRK